MTNAESKGATMADELREQVARRLHNSIAPHGDEDWARLGDRERANVRRMADECIRLMEWARHEEEHNPSNLLTLPPDGWTP